MRLLLGHQNLISYCNIINNGYVGDDDSMFNAPGNLLTATSPIVAPDGSSSAVCYISDGAGTENLQTEGRADFVSGEHVYSYGVLFKPWLVSSSSLPMRVSLYNVTSIGGTTFGVDCMFTNKLLSSITPYSGAEAPFDYGFEVLDDNWYLLYHTFDTRNIDPGQSISLQLRINHVYAGAGWNGGYVWGHHLEKTTKRNRVSPQVQTLTTKIDEGDFLAIDFTQLPSNIEEVDNNVFEEKQFTSGLKARAATSVDKNKKTLVWNMINYVNHGYMIYQMRQALRDKVSLDCVLEYPSGFKSHIKSAKIRVTDFRFTYTGTRDYAQVELDYYIVESQIF